LFFYGNGETACDYDGIAPLYNQIGANFFVADYRGYGRSGGLPAFSLMLSDAHQVLQALAKILDSAQYSKDIYVMGRSMGRHPAFEIGANAGDSIKGLIVESGRASLAQFTRGLDSSIAQPLEAAYQDKVRSITAPVLVIHGELDQLAPVQHAAVMFESFSSENKRMVTIPGAGHNDLLHQGLQEYFAAISALLFS
jgi:pimeloyl-ACP methyl ester carboxylesterase